MLPAVRKKHPKAQLKLIEAQSHELIERVKSGEIDTAILALPYPHEGLLSLDFWEEDFYVVLNEQDEHSDQVSIKGQLLKNKSLLLLKDGHCLTDHTLKACRFKPQKDNISLEPETTEINLENKKKDESFVVKCIKWNGNRTIVVCFWRFTI